MAINDFYPFEDGQVITAAEWNELFSAIADGSFFTASSPISDQISTLADRVAALEARMNGVASMILRQRAREQFVLSANQASIVLSNAPVLDTEMVAVNGQVWSKTGVPTDFVGDYSLTGNTITFNPEQVVNIAAGDVVVITYDFEV